MWPFQGGKGGYHRLCPRTCKKSPRDFVFQGLDKPQPHSCSRLAPSPKVFLVPHASIFLCKFHDYHSIPASILRKPVMQTWSWGRKRLNSFLKNSGWSVWLWHQNFIQLRVRVLNYVHIKVSSIFIKCLMVTIHTWKVAKEFIVCGSNILEELNISDLVSFCPIRNSVPC